jgi:hypothetical protein
MVLTQEEGWSKSVENLTASPFRRHLPKDTTSAKSISLESLFKRRISLSDWCQP